MTDVHQFTIGEIQCAMILEGASPLDMANLQRRYPNHSEAEIIEALGGNNSSSSSLNILYINSNGTQIIADVGFGEVRRPDMGKLEEGLNSIGVSAQDIDLVFLTHFHGDHIIGLVDASGNPSFPNARYMTNEKEWEEWMRRWGDADDEGAKNNLKMMQSFQDKFVLASDGDEVADGVTMVEIPGHTLGQTGLLIASNGESLIHLADVLHGTLQFENLDWQFAFDSDGALGVETRKSILKRCADENRLTAFYHLPFPGIGHVKVAGDAFAWEPIERP